MWVRLSKWELKIQSKIRGCKAGFAVEKLEVRKRRVGVLDHSGECPRKNDSQSPDSRWVVATRVEFTTKRSFWFSEGRFTLCDLVNMQVHFCRSFQWVHPRTSRSRNLLQTCPQSSGRQLSRMRNDVYFRGPNVPHLVGPCGVG